jgi:hypothetical protein
MTTVYRTSAGTITGPPTRLDSLDLERRPWCRDVTPGTRAPVCLLSPEEAANEHEAAMRRRFPDDPAWSNDPLRTDCDCNTENEVSMSDPKHNPNARGVHAARLDTSDDLDPEAARVRMIAARHLAFTKGLDPSVAKDVAARLHSAECARVDSAAVRRADGSDGSPDKLSPEDEAKRCANLALDPEEVRKQKAIARNRSGWRRPLGFSKDRINISGPDPNASGPGDDDAA